MARPLQPTTTPLGVRLREIRGRVSQSEVAKYCGVPAKTLSRIERGTHVPSLATAIRLAEWVGVTVEELVAMTQRSPTPAESDPSPSTDGPTPDMG